MMPHSHDDLPPLAETEDLTLTKDLRQLASEAKALAQAELTFQKSRAAYAGSETKVIAVLALAAALIVLFALMAFVVGTVIALGPVLGLWGAMAAVVVALLLCAGACGLAAKARAKRMMSIVSDNGSN
jgi:Protein of unknown function (DUF1469).